MKLTNANLRLFAAIADGGSLSAAARHLGMQKSTVSRELAQLETRLGHRLVERSSRQTRLTEVGQLLLVHAHRVMEEIQAAEASIEALTDEPSGRLNLSLPHAVAQKLVLPLLPMFLHRYPQISIGLDLTVRNADLIAEGVDLAIRVGALPASSLIARQLGTLPIILAASPTYLKRAGLPQCAEDLEKLETIALGGVQSTCKWKFDGPGGQSEVTIQPRVTSTEVAMIRDLAVAGLGVASLPKIFIADDLARGTLVHVLPDLVRGAPPIHAVYPSRKSLATKTRVFMDAITAELAQKQTVNA